MLLLGTIFVELSYPGYVDSALEAYAEYSHSVDSPFLEYLSLVPFIMLGVLSMLPLPSVVPSLPDVPIGLLFFFWGICFCIVG